MKFLVINGPNLNLTQFTEPGMEGQIDFNTLLDYIEAGCSQMDVQVDFSSPTTRVTSSMRSSRRQAGPMASSSTRAATPITAWPFWKRCRCAACPPWK